MDYRELLRVALRALRANKLRSVLTMFGHRVEGVVVNRMFPSGGDGWRDGWCPDCR